MKKFKLFIMAMVFVASISSAFITRPKFDCTAGPNYYWDGTMYVLAGKYGTDYCCLTGIGNCTYYLTLQGYQPCRYGIYLSFGNSSHH